MSGKKQETLQERVERQLRERGEPVPEGYELSPEGKVIRTPSRDEFFGNLERVVSQPDAGDSTSEGGAPQ